MPDLTPGYTVSDLAARFRVGEDRYLERTPHPAVRMAAVDMDHDVHGDPVGWHD